MPRPLEFWFEFASTYSYPAAMRVQDACAARGVPLLWRPFLLGPVFAAQGLTDSPFNLFPAKGAYMWRDLERECARLGLPLVRPSRFPRGSLLAARIACAHADSPWIGPFIRATYAANFADDRDIDHDDVIAALLDGIGQDPAPILAAATTPDAKSALRAQTEAAQARGIFGAPSFVVGDELFWGHDRMTRAIDWAADA
jgi:2-hydroxychromene-2-carboxylate isomerase